MDLKEETRKLISLQELDSELYALIQEKDKQKPALIQKLKQESEQEKASLKSFQDKLKETQLKKKQKELDLSSKEEAVRKAQSQLYQLKTNKEYKAKLGEIESLKADVSALEEEVLLVLDEIEAAEKKLAQAKEKVEQKDKELAEKEEKIKGEIKDLQVKIDQLNDKRSLAAKEIDAKSLSIYERLIDTCDGQAIAKVVNGSCNACNMKVTAQKVNEIKMYKDFVFCDMCTRILYLEDDFSL
jgi:hypothetical protein